MTVTIELSPNLERELKSRAEAQGVSTDTYVVRVLERDLQSSLAPKTEMGRRILEWVDSLPEAPALSDEAISRESIYEDRL
jgi:hypothetical protein